MNPSPTDPYRLLGLPITTGVPRPSYITNVFLDFSIFYGINRCSGGFGKVRLVTPEVLTKFQLKRPILDPFREIFSFQKKLGLGRPVVVVVVVEVVVVIVVQLPGKK